VLLKDKVALIAGSTTEIGHATGLAMANARSRDRRSRDRALGVDDCDAPRCGGKSPVSRD
jgi:NAD(P)-dependent dehydrogenase (short-subunit alcohol dehydrogenase family)